MIRSHEENDSSRGTYLYSKVSYTSDYKYTYVWYEQNGVKRMETHSEKLMEPRTTKSVKTKSVTKATPKKNIPTNIPKSNTEAKKVAKTVLDDSKSPDSSFFTRSSEQQTAKTQVVPQPPPAPSPKPNFQAAAGESVTKHEYLYGMKDLSIGHKQYENRSVYVSKPINVAGNVMSVSLSAIEEHPFFDHLSGAAADRQTSVEYYIAPVGANPIPTLDDWLPILPENQKTVLSELLMFGTARTAELRFPALIGSRQKAVVYKNGLAMDEDEWSFIDGGAGMQLLVTKDATAIYTIDYTPNSEFYNPWTVDVHQKDGKPVKVIETFENGTNHNKTVVLSHYPYVNYERINTTSNYNQNTSSYVPIKVTLKDAGIIGPSRTTYKEVLPFKNASQYVFTKNVTDYKTGTHPALKPYSIDPDSLYNGFEYYHEGDKLYFSQTFNKADIMFNEQESHGNAKIAVEYEYLSSDFRLKIILRRNSTDENTLTPIVHEYTLKFKVMK